MSGHTKYFGIGGLKRQVLHNCPKHSENVSMKRWTLFDVEGTKFYGENQEKSKFAEVAVILQHDYTDDILAFK